MPTLRSRCRDSCRYAIRIVKSIKRFEHRPCLVQPLESLCSFSIGLRPLLSIRLALFFTFPQHFEPLCSLRLVVDLSPTQSLSIVLHCFAQHLQSLCSLLTNCCLCLNLSCFLLLNTSFLDSLDCSSPTG